MKIIPLSHPITKIISQGAEAMITESSYWEVMGPGSGKFAGPLLRPRKAEHSNIPHNQQTLVIIKERFAKVYRAAELDRSLRQFRTRRESKMLRRLEQSGFPSPRVIFSDDKEMTIIMSKIKGPTLREHLLKKRYNASLGKSLGKLIGELHNINIIHQDLTTSNMIKGRQGISIIDFGLSFFSEKYEDKAVDLFLLERAIISTHWAIYVRIWRDIVRGYSSKSKQYGKILDRLEEVKMRGRNKSKSVN